MSARLPSRVCRACSHDRTACTHTVAPLDTGLPSARRAPPLPLPFRTLVASVHCRSHQAVTNTTCSPHCRITDAQGAFRLARPPTLVSVDFSTRTLQFLAIASAVHQTPTNMRASVSRRQQRASLGSLVRCAGRAAPDMGPQQGIWVQPR